MFCISLSTVLCIINQFLLILTNHEVLVVVREMCEHGALDY